MADIGTDIALATFGLAILAYAVKLTWQVSRIEQEQRDYVDAQVENLQRDISEAKASSLDRAETIRHETGEMGSALRQKIHEIEVWSRDSFVRKESFELVISRIEKSIEKMTDKLEDKLDKAVARFERRQD